MKNIFTICILLFAMIMMFACKKDKNRQSGVCYCEFVKGDDQQYDLSGSTRQEQIDQCNIHDKNAANFGGHCELE